MNRKPMLSWFDVRVVWADAPIDQPRELLVLVALLLHTDCDGMSDVSTRTIAALVKCSPRQVYRWVGDLEKRGLVSVDKRLGKRNRYQLNQCLLDVTGTKNKAVTSTSKTSDTQMSHHKDEGQKKTRVRVRDNQPSRRPVYNRTGATTTEGDTFIPGTGWVRDQ